MSKEFVILFLQTLETVENSLKSREARNDSNLHAGIVKELKQALIRRIKGNDYSLAREISQTLKKGLIFKFRTWALQVNFEYMNSQKDTVYLPDEELFRMMKGFPSFNYESRSEWIKDIINHQL